MKALYPALFPVNIAYRYRLLSSINPCTHTPLSPALAPTPRRHRKPCDIKV